MLRQSLTIDIERRTPLADGSIEPEPGAGPSIEIVLDASPAVAGVGVDVEVGWDESPKAF